MDIFTHFLWFFVLTWNKYFAKGKKFFGVKWNKTSGFLFAVAPDIALLPYFAFIGYNMALGMTLAQAKASAPLWVYSVYQFFHSYIFWAAVSLLLYLFVREYFMPFLLGWGLHITIDLFIHEGNFANRPFFGISSLAVNGFIEWDKSWIFIAFNFAVLALVFFWFWRKGLTWKKFWKEIF